MYADTVSLVTLVFRNLEAQHLHLKFIKKVNYTHNEYDNISVISRLVQ